MNVGFARPHRGRPAAYRAGPRLLLAVLVMFLGTLGVGGRASAATPVSSVSSVSSASEPESVRLADQLRRDPVYVSDQMPRDVPRSTAPQFARLARRTGVPTYVLVLPNEAVGGKALLGAVHDRLGRDGLYVLVDDLAVGAAVSFGVSAPADDADTIALYSLPYDAGPLKAFRVFVDAIGEGAERAGRQAAQLEAEYGDTGKRVPDAYIDDSDRENQSFLTGCLLLGVPALILLVSPYIRRLRRRWRTAEPPVVRLAKGTGRPARAPRWPYAAEFGAAVLVAGLVTLGAPHVFPQKYDSLPVSPTRADLTHRLDRVAAGLRTDPVYTDLESPQLLTAAQHSDLERRIAAFKPGPVFIALVPSQPDDESGGDTDALLNSLHQRVGRAGVYVCADPVSGEITLDDWGMRLDQDRLSFGLPDSIAYEDPYHSTDDHRMGQRLDALMTLLDRTPTTTSPSNGFDDRKAEPLDSSLLPTLFGSDDFGAGLAMGGVGALLLWGALAVAFSTARSVRAARLRRELAMADSVVNGHPDAPATPSPAYLRRTAQHELDALATEFNAADPQGKHRAEAYDCLDAALLLVDREPDGRLDDAVTSADLTAAIVLARAGRATLAGRPTRNVCGVNPLHGPSRGRRPVGHGAGTPRELPVCAACETAVRRDQARAAGRWLMLQETTGDRTPYEAAQGPLPSVTGGMARLIAKTREYASVQ
jgi:hypothetical protein